MAYERTLVFELNRLAGTLDSSNAPTLEEQGAANAWAGTVGLATVGALNALNGTTGLGLRAVCNALAGTVDEDEAPALSHIA